MTFAVFNKLLALMLTVGLGWAAGRWAWLGDSKATRVLSNAAFYLFIPALLFRTTSRIAVAELPFRVLAAFFVPAGALMLLLYVHQRARGPGQGPGVAVPSVRAITATFGNTVQLGIPLAMALFGEAGLGLHLTIVSVHALVLLGVITFIVEANLARERNRLRQGGSRWAALASMLRSTLIHPVVMPVLLGLLWNATGQAVPAVLDELLVVLSQAVLPVCLMLIGLSLAQYGVAGRTRNALLLTAIKLLLLPALVLAVGYLAFGLRGTPLSVLVMAAALPVGSNPLIFAQRYRTLEAETTAAIVISTLGFALTAPLWLALLHGL